jgi:phospholipid/cholesterol/gamma-HCH transport system substrate-binding protein
VRFLRKYARNFAAIIGLALIGLIVGGFILSNQRFYLPHGVPVLGSDFVDYKAELSTAQAVTPGQGQTVNIAGVPVGEISNVDLVDGRAVVTMRMRRKYTPIFRDASALLRPKTGLNDMIIELDPGTRGAGELPRSEPISISRTLPNVNFDEVLAGLDVDTRTYLQLLLHGGAEALGSGAGPLVSETLKRFEPLSRDLAKVTDKLQERRANISRTVTNFRKLSEAIGDKDTDLSRLVDSSNAVFKSLANQDANLRATLRQLPPTLGETQRALGKTDRLATRLGPTLSKLRPAARALGPSLRQTRPFLRETTPVIRKQLRPFARESLPAVRVLRPAAADLAKVTPDLSKALGALNVLVDELAYNPPGEAEEGYLFWASWAGHLGPTLFSNQDAHGPIRRGIVLLSCSSLATLNALTKVNPQLGTIIGLLDKPDEREVCPQLPASATPTPAASTPAPGGGG